MYYTLLYHRTGVHLTIGTIHRLHPGTQICVICVFRPKRRPLEDNSKDTFLVEDVHDWMTAFL